MHISILTLFPNMINGFLSESIIKKAQARKKVIIDVVNLRNFATDTYKTVDGKPYGGGIGMIMRVDVIYAALEKIKKPDSYILLTSARGKVYSQKKAVEYSTYKDIIIIAGHYEGVDERVTYFIDEEISVGDYILTGGELPSCIITDSVVRLIPGVLKHTEAVEIESFSLQKDKPYLEYPQYTRPQEFMGYKVPSILLSGNHGKIESWRKKEAQRLTEKRRPDLLDR